LIVRRPTRVLIDGLVQHGDQFKLTASASPNSFGAEGGICGGKEMEE